MRQIEDLLKGIGLRVRVQPIVSFCGSATETIAMEALTSGPAGTNFADASVLFAYARRLRAEKLLDRTCVQLAIETSVHLDPDVRLSINLHAATISHDLGLSSFISSVAAANGLDTDRLIVEIVEHAEAWSESTLGKGIERLRGIGARIALDDVGLGVSNYKMVLDTAPDYLKIDRYFVTGSAHDERRRKVLRSIRHLAGEFDAEVIAEGVETESDLQAIREIGVTLGQGYFFARPYFPGLRDTEAFSRVESGAVSEDGGGA